MVIKAEITPLLILAFFLGLIYSIVKIIYKIVVLIRVRNWPKTEVDELYYKTYVEKENETRTERVDYHDGSPPTYRTYTVTKRVPYVSVEYFYKVNGVLYKNKMITPFDKEKVLPHAEFFYLYIKEPENYLREICKVTNDTFYAYYNPKNPSDSFLTKEGCVSDIIGGIISCFIILVVLFLWILFL